MILSIYENYSSLIYLFSLLLLNKHISKHSKRSLKEDYMKAAPTSWFANKQFTIEDGASPIENLSKEKTELQLKENLANTLATLLAILGVHASFQSFPKKWFLMNKIRYLVSLLSWSLMDWISWKRLKASKFLTILRHRGKGEYAIDKCGIHINFDPTFFRFVLKFN